MSSDVKTNEVLTPDSPRRETFCEGLHEWLSDCGCEGGTNKRNAIAVMSKMGGVDIPGSIAYFEDHGGFCDCEILMNVQK